MSELVLIEYNHKPSRRWVWPWQATGLVNREIQISNELRQRNESQARRIRELDDLCQRQQAELIRIEQAKPKKRSKRR